MLNKQTEVFYATVLQKGLLWQKIDFRHRGVLTTADDKRKGLKVFSIVRSWRGDNLPKNHFSD